VISCCAVSAFYDGLLLSTVVFLRVRSNTMNPAKALRITSVVAVSAAVKIHLRAPIIQGADAQIMNRLVHQ